MKRSLIIIFAFILTCYSGTLTAQNEKKIHPDVQAYIATHKQLAISEMKRTGVPASIKLAQGIIETQAGKSDLVQRSNNHFGIKCKTNWVGDKVYHDDDEKGECFRAYQSSEESYRDHSDFLKGSARYSALFTLRPTDYKGWANGLKKAGYATNPKYPLLLIKTIEDYNLELYTDIALGVKKDPDELLARNNQHTAPAISNVSEKKAIVVVPSQMTKTAQQPEKEAERRGSPLKKHWPLGTFTINGVKVVYSKAGTSMLSLALQHNIALAKLFEFNEMSEVNVLESDQLVFLQKKKKVGSEEYHIVKSGETLVEIAQEQGMRLESLLEFNGMHRATSPAAGEKLSLKKKNTGKVLLADNL